MAPLYSENMKRAPLQVFILAWGVNHPWLVCAELIHECICVCAQFPVLFVADLLEFTYNRLAGRIEHTITLQIDKLYNDVLLETQDRREIIKSNVSKSSAPSRSSTPHSSVVLSSSGPLEIFHILSWSVTAALQSPHAECRRWFIGGGNVVNQME